MFIGLVIMPKKSETTVATLRERAKKLGIKGYSTMRKAELQKAISGSGKIRSPKKSPTKKTLTKRKSPSKTKSKSYTTKSKTTTKKITKKSSQKTKGVSKHATKTKHSATKKPYHKPTLKTEIQPVVPLLPAKPVVVVPYSTSTPQGRLLRLIEQAHQITDTFYINGFYLSYAEVLCDYLNRGFPFDPTSTTNFELVQRIQQQIPDQEYIIICLDYIKSLVPWKTGIVTLYKKNHSCFSTWNFWSNKKNPEDISFVVSQGCNGFSITPDGRLQEKWGKFVVPKEIFDPKGRVDGRTLDFIAASLKEIIENGPKLTKQVVLFRGDNDQRFASGTKSPYCNFQSQSFLSTTWDSNITHWFMEISLEQGKEGYLSRYVVPPGTPCLYVWDEDFANEKEILFPLGACFEAIDEGWKRVLYCSDDMGRHNLQQDSHMTKVLSRTFVAKARPSPATFIV